MCPERTDWYWLGGRDSNPGAIVQSHFSYVPPNRTRSRGYALAAARYDGALTTAALDDASNLRLGGAACPVEAREGGTQRAPVEHDAIVDESRVHLTHACHDREGELDVT
jgi:hypothetical protein